MIPANHHLRATRLLEHVKHICLKHWINCLNRNASAVLHYMRAIKRREEKIECSKVRMRSYQEENEIHRRARITHLWHREHINTSDGVVIDELAKHEAHNLHGHTVAPWSGGGKRSGKKRRALND